MLRPGGQNSPLGNFYDFFYGFKNYAFQGFPGVFTLSVFSLEITGFFIIHISGGGCSNQWLYPNTFDGKVSSDLAVFPGYWSSGHSGPNNPFCRKALRNLLVLVLHQPELVVAPADADTADAEEDEVKEDEEVKDEDEGQKETQDCRCYKFFGMCFLLFVAGVFLCLLFPVTFGGFLGIFSWLVVLAHNTNRPSNLQFLTQRKWDCGTLKSQLHTRHPSEYENGLMKDIHPTSAEEKSVFW